MSTTPIMGPASPPRPTPCGRPGEEVVYVAALYTGTGVEEPDFLATVDIDPSSEKRGPDGA